MQDHDTPEPIDTEPKDSSKSIQIKVSKEIHEMLRQTGVKLNGQTPQQIAALLVSAENIGHLEGRWSELFG